MTTMLRKKLLARLGLLVVGFVAGAVVAIILLQGVLRDLDAQNASSDAMMERVQSISEGISRLEAALSMAQGPERASAVQSEAKALQKTLIAFQSEHLVGGQGVAGGPAWAKVEQLLGPYLQVGAAGGPAREDVALSQAVAELSAVARRHVAQEQAAVSWRLRTLIIGLTIAALIMTNVSILVLVRTAGMILKPVGELIEGSRQLARENFAHRIEVAQNDEFQELAQAYNMLAGELAANEEKKVKSLRQLAITLNHELNNVINVIELQLALLNRRSGRDPALASHLSDIHDNLGRISQTIASLRDVRRIVLTDYVAGERMLDIPRSVAREEPPASTLRPAAGQPLTTRIDGDPR